MVQSLLFAIHRCLAPVAVMNPFRPRFHIRDILKFTAIVCVVLALFSWSGVGLALQADWRMSVYPLGVAVLCAFSIMRPRARSPRCESCGRRFFRTRKGELSGLCPACRVAKVSPEQHRRLAIQGFVIIFILLLMLSFVLAYPFAGFISSPRLVLPTRLSPSVCS